MQLHLQQLKGQTTEKFARTTVLIAFTALPRGCSQKITLQLPKKQFYRWLSPEDGSAIFVS
jgi:hypothetical protein